MVNSALSKRQPVIGGRHHLPFLTSIPHLTSEIYNICPTIRREAALKREPVVEKVQISCMLDISYAYVYNPVSPIL